ncbi:hypothetical protein S7711_04045 [Stachybotrys chartarum IBT 7711]|uniref:Uncharacterized protein n=1 Tax=Stachybotrys chartarum (strain CBS 109288 / IBT 7711) TaxID=1280523 RepID=A0A084AXK1_STACB|nr:hypothetical protein S7711_04045 [Stachybotrys chartarum IBT 7711]
MAAYSTDPALYIYTSLTAGSSHIVTATSRLETILRANRVPFKAIDIATDQKARMLWGRRAGKDEGGRVRKLPALVQEGLVLGDIVEIEDWNEYGELKQHVKIYYDEHTIPSIHNKPPELMKPAKPAARNAPAPTPAPVPAAPPLPEPKAAAAEPATKSKAEGKPEAGKSTTLPIRSVADEAAQKAKELRLKSLREKVHGKNSESSTTAATASTTSDDKVKKTVVERDGSSTPGLQSPTSGAWKQSSRDDALRETLQSPTSAAWKSGAIGAGPAAAKSGAEVAVASNVEIKAVEKAMAIKEEPELEEKASKTDAAPKAATPATKKVVEDSDSDEDDSDDSDEEEDDDDDDDDDDDEEEDGDEDEDDDDSDDDEDEDSDDDSDDSGKEAPAKPATATSTKTASK